MDDEIAALKGANRMRKSQNRLPITFVQGGPMAQFFQHGRERLALGIHFTILSEMAEQPLGHTHQFVEYIIVPASDMEAYANETGWQTMARHTSRQGLIASETLEPFNMRGCLHRFGWPDKAK